MPTYRTRDINYNMGDAVLGTTVKEKDLGITITVWYCSFKGLSNSWVD